MTNEEIFKAALKFRYGSEGRHPMTPGALAKVLTEFAVSLFEVEEAKSNAAKQEQSEAFNIARKGMKL